MAISKKGKRKIIVGKDEFYWTYKFQAEVLRLIIMLEEKSNSRLVCDFNYDNLCLYFKGLVSSDELRDFLIITPGIFTPWVVRQVIDYGLLNGWKPFEKGKDFFVKDIEKNLDINFWTETTPETRKSAIQNPQSKI
ncbi:MAG TPA: hypothetical protein PKY82_05815 [Pyrinomonadaceae bacterium]|nr:hypothetical protein [Pyrinomonadaceae bacterium]